MAFEHSTFSAMVKIDYIFFQLHLLFANASTILLLIIIIYSWGTYLVFIKLFSVHNNCLPLIEIFTVNKIIYR